MASRADDVVEVEVEVEVREAVCMFELGWLEATLYRSARLLM